MQEDVKMTNQITRQKISGPQNTIYKNATYENVGVYPVQMHVLDWS